VTVFVTRERGEHLNMYHSMTDFFNAFVSLEMLNIDPTQVCYLFVLFVSYSWSHIFVSFEDCVCFVVFWLYQVQVVVIDSHDPSPLDGWWDQVISHKSPMKRAHDFGDNTRGNRRYRFEHAIFSPPGYSSLFFADLNVLISTIPHFQCCYLMYCVHGLG
jgi:hypothetical protein